MHLLVIEDERALCETIVRSLRRLAYSVDYCYDGEKALALLGVERYDLVPRKQDSSEEDTGEKGIYQYREAAVNTAKGTLSRGEKELVLTKNEMIIFLSLLNNIGKIVSRDELMTALWDNEEYINDNALTVNISRLRAKLSDFGYEDAIETRKKQGYCLV